MKQYLPHAAIAVLLGAVCVSAQAKPFKCLSNPVDCTAETTDFSTPTLSDSTDLTTTTTTFTSKSKDGKHGGTGSSNTGGGTYTPSGPGIATAVPEPESYAMMALGLGILAWSLRRRSAGRL